MKTFFSELLPSLRATLVLAAVTCGAYPLLVTGMARTLYPERSGGSLTTNQEGRVVGSTLLGQGFAAEHYFHPRPSAAGAGHDASSSGGSNLGPTSRKLRDQIQARLADYRAGNGLAADAIVPADAVTASGSGLDPHISVANAALQAPRVARARSLGVEAVRALIDRHTEGPFLGILGDPAVNVLKLNLALDALK